MERREAGRWRLAQEAFDRRRDELEPEARMPGPFYSASRLASSAAFARFCDFLFLSRPASNEQRLIPGQEC